MPYLIGSLHDGARDIRFKTKLFVNNGSGFLENSKCLDERSWHALVSATNIEVLQRAICGLGHTRSRVFLRSSTEGQVAAKRFA